MTAWTELEDWADRAAPQKFRQPGYLIALPLNQPGLAAGPTNGAGLPLW
jgi:hypothetical protein